MERIGHEVWFYYVSFQPGEQEIMRSHWGEHYLSYHYCKPWRKYQLWGIPIPDRWSHTLVSRGWVSQKIDQFYDDHMQKTLCEFQIEHNFDAVVVNYVFFSKALETFPDTVLKVIDTHDVYTDRHKRLLENDLRPDWFFTSREEEKKGLERADKVIAIQSREADFFSKLLGRETGVETVGHLFDPPGKSQIVPVQNPLRFGMLGSNNLLNVQALRWFMEKVAGNLPDDFTLKLWGSVCDSIPDHPKIRKMGIVENLATAYQEADVFLNPMQWGTGLKIKTLEALSYGRLVISTPCGLEGIDDAESEGCWMEKTAEGWIRRIRGMLDGKKDYSSASQSNLDYTRQYLEENRSALRRIFNT